MSSLPVLKTNVVPSISDQVDGWNTPRVDQCDSKAQEEVMVRVGQTVD